MPFTASLPLASLVLYTLPQHPLPPALMPLLLKPDIAGLCYSDSAPTNTCSLHRLLLNCSGVSRSGRLTLGTISSTLAEGDGGGDEHVKIGPIGNAVGTCSFDVNMAESPRIEYKSLPAGAERIVDKLIAAGGGAALGRATLAHNSILATYLNAEAQGGGEPPAADVPDAG